MTGSTPILRGHTVLLLGGVAPETKTVPEIREREISADDEWDLRVEEAVIALARAVFIHGGQLAFSHDALLTPLVLEIARDYWQAPPAEHVPTGQPTSELSDPYGEETAPVMILADPSQLPELSAYAYTFNRYAAGRVLGWFPRGRLLCAVCIGGGPETSGRVAEFDLRRVPRFAIASTGGLALELIRRADFESEQFLWIDPETQFSSDINQRISFAPPEEFGPVGTGTSVELPPDFRYAVYPLVMAQILDHARPRA